MVNYINSKCFKCKENFKENDDIVVCPDCGTPYHRECYVQEGHCINSELHQKHETYHDETEKAKATNTAVRCPFCECENPPLSLFCRKCGMPLNTDTPNDIKDARYNKDFNYENYGSTVGAGAFKINFSDPLCGIKPDEDFDGVTAKELADFIVNNVYYYLPMFKRFKDTGHKFSINFSGMFIPTFYFAYRKMHLPAILTIILQLIISIPTFIVMLQSNYFFSSSIIEFAKNFDVNSNEFMLFYNFCGFLSYVIMLLSGTFANYIYYRYAVYRIKKLKECERADRKSIKNSGGVSKVNVIIYSVSLFLLSILLSFITVFA